MTSDERLVAKVGKELLEQNGIITPVHQVAVDGDGEKLRMPCMVVSATLTEDTPRSSLPKSYSLKVEQRYIKKPEQVAAIDEGFAQVKQTLCPDTSGSFGYIAPTMARAFSWFSVENQTGSEPPGDGETITRSRTFAVLASLL